MRKRSGNKSKQGQRRVDTGPDQGPGGTKRAKIGPKQGQSESQVRVKREPGSIQETSQNRTNAGSTQGHNGSGNETNLKTRPTGDVNMVKTGSEQGHNRVKTGTQHVLAKNKAKTAQSESQVRVK